MNAEIVVVGQGPGKEEERHKPVPQPLVGWSGRRLVYLLAVAGVIPLPPVEEQTKEWYEEARADLPIRLENVTRCRPPRIRTGDLTPTPAEIDAALVLYRLRYGATTERIRGLLRWLEQETPRLIGEDEGLLLSAQEATLKELNHVQNGAG